jgi:hypothetical protein
MGDLPQYEKLGVTAKQIRNFIATQVTTFHRAMEKKDSTGFGDLDDATAEDNDERLDREESDSISDSISEFIDIKSTSISSSSSSSASSFSISRSYASKNSIRSDFRGMIA